MFDVRHSRSIGCSRWRSLPTKPMLQLGSGSTKQPGIPLRVLHIVHTRNGEGDHGCRLRRSANPDGGP
jgi:hypothetical protein